MLNSQLAKIMIDVKVMLEAQSVVLIKMNLFLI
jgi:hypothetical protein